MDDAERAGSRVVFSYPGATVPDDLLDLVARGRAAGVIFFAENVPGLREAVRALRAANGVRPPLLLATDQEGGWVRRLPGGPDRAPRAASLASDPLRAARETGREAADAIERAGLNVNLAPVVDVSRASGDAIDHAERGFGRDPGQVGELAALVAGRARARGIASVAKHFPGLGTAPHGSDTDRRPLTLPVSREELDRIDLEPFRALIADGIEAIMPSWAVYPALDAHRPAGTSPPVLRVLRRDLGFVGVIVSDALEAGALTGSTGARAIAAVRAGVDVVLCSARDVEQGREAARSIERTDPSSALASLARLDLLRRRLR